MQGQCFIARELKHFTVFQHEILPHKLYTKYSGNFVHRNNRERIAAIGANNDTLFGVFFPNEGFAFFSQFNQIGGLEFQRNAYNGIFLA